MKRGLIDRLTNRDIVGEQKTHIDILMREARKKNELITMQAEAIDEFREQVTKLGEEISELWDTVNKTARRKKDESKTDESG